MSYFYNLGGGRGKSRFQIFSNNMLIWDTQLITSVSPIKKKQLGETITLENNELCLIGSAFRESCSITFIIDDAASAYGVAILLNFLNGVLQGTYQLNLYPEYSSKYLEETQDDFRAIPVGDISKKWTHDFLETMHELTLNFESTNVVPMSFGVTLPYIPQRTCQIALAQKPIE